MPQYGDGGEARLQGGLVAKTVYALRESGDDDGFGATEGVDELAAEFLRVVAGASRPDHGDARVLDATVAVACGGRAA